MSLNITGDSNFVYEHQGAATSDFFVALPAMRADDNYFVTATVQKQANSYSIVLPDQQPTDRDSRQFRVKTSANVSANDRIEFHVYNRNAQPRLGISPLWRDPDGYFGAKLDGLTDDTGALREAVAGASTAGAGLVIWPSGEAILSNTIEVDSPSTGNPINGLRIVGSGAGPKGTSVRWLGPPGIPAFKFDGTQNCGVSEIRILVGSTDSVTNISVSVDGSTKVFTRSGGGDFTATFEVHQYIRWVGFTNAGNNTTKKITALTATMMTVEDPTNDLVTEGSGIRSVFGTGERFLLAADMTAGVDATNNKYYRSTGSFLDDGFVPGQTVRWSGFTNPGNNTTKRIVQVTALDMTVVAGGLVTEGPASGRKVAFEGSAFQASLSGLTVNVSSSGTYQLFDMPGLSFLKSGGFAVGQLVTWYGFTHPENNGTKTITALTDVTMTVAETGLVDELMTGLTSVYSQNLKTAIEIGQDTSPVAPSRHNISGVQLLGDGHVGTAVHYKLYNTANDNKNDFNVISVCQLQGYQDAGIRIEGYNAKKLFFDQVLVQGRDTGRIGIDTASIPGYGGSFVIYGGSVQENKDWDFRLGKPNDPILVSGVYSQSSSRCFTVLNDESGPQPTIMWPVTFDGYKWSAQLAEIAADNIIVDIKSPGPVAMRGCRIGGNVAVGQLKFRYRPQRIVDGLPENIRGSFSFENSVISSAQADDTFWADLPPDSMTGLVHHDNNGNITRLIRGNTDPYDLGFFVAQKDSDWIERGMPVPRAWHLADSSTGNAAGLVLDEQRRYKVLDLHPYNKSASQFGQSVWHWTGTSILAGGTATEAQQLDDANNDIDTSDSCLAIGFHGLLEPVGTDDRVLLVLGGEGTGVTAGPRILQKANGALRIFCNGTNIDGTISHVDGNAHTIIALMDRGNTTLGLPQRMMVITDLEIINWMATQSFPIDVQSTSNKGIGATTLPTWKGSWRKFFCWTGADVHRIRADGTPGNWQPGDIMSLLRDGRRQMPYLAGTGTLAFLAGNSNLTVTWPPHKAGDVGLLFVETRSEAVTVAGWTLLTSQTDSSNSTRLHVFWKRATTGSETNPTVSGTPTDHKIAAIMTFRGCRPGGNPHDVLAGGGSTSSSTSQTIPGLTTTAAKCLVVLAATWSTDTATGQVSAFSNSSLSGLWQYKNEGSTVGDGGGLWIGTGGKVVAGTVGATALTFSASTPSAYVAIALRR